MGFGRYGVDAIAGWDGQSQATLMVSVRLSAGAGQYFPLTGR